MGLDTTHDCWHGPYSKFHRWRTWLAQQVDIPLPLMFGFYDGEIVPEFYAMHESARWRLSQLEKHLPIQWGSLKPDIIHALLHHSDCDGDLAADIVGPLADRLQEVLDAGVKLPDNEGDHDFVDRLRTFVEGLRAAAEAGEAVEFH